ncbi:MAG: ABC transporter substrate-binding protein [Nitrospiraceae bacterium]
MGKKITILAIAFAIIAFTQPAYAQQAGKVYRIGYLAPNRINPAFPQGLKELGYIQGQNLILEFRRGKGMEYYLRLAKELVDLKVDLILSVGIGATRAAKQATSSIPIVMGNSSVDPVRQGLIDSLARPGGNVTGVIDLVPNLAGKRLGLLKEIFPKLSRIGHLYAPSIAGLAHLKATQAAARKMGVRVQDLKVGGPDDLESAFRAAAEGGAEAFIVVGVGFFTRHKKRIANLEVKNRLPTMHTHRRWVPFGGLITYTTDSRARYRRAAQFVDRILKGAKPADLPVEQPTKFLLEVNLKTAKALGITFPRSILLRATKVIE